MSGFGAVCEIQVVEEAAQVMKKLFPVWIPILLVGFATVAASAQSFRVQCPTSTITHPAHPSAGNNCVTNPTGPGCNNTEPAYNGPTQFNAATADLPRGTSGDFITPKPATANGAIKCQQISGGDGLSTMGDGNQIFMFGFGPLSGLADVAAGHAGTEFPYVFNNPYSNFSSIPLTRGDPATTDQAASGAAPWLNYPAPFSPAFTWNGAVGLAPDVASVVSVSNLVEGPIPAGSTVPGCPHGNGTTVTAWTDAPLGIPVGAPVQIALATAEGGISTPPGYTGTWTVSCVATGSAITPDGFNEYAFQYTDTNTGLASDTGNALAATAASPSALDGHVDPRPIMDVGVMNGNIPAPLVAIDEDDEFGTKPSPTMVGRHGTHYPMPGFAGHGKS